MIQLQPTQNARQEIHLIVYSYPGNCPENATKSLQPVSTSEDFSPLEEDQPHDLCKTSESTSSLESLPLEIQHTIQYEPLLQERLGGIIQAYQASSVHPSFDIFHFKKKMLSCMNYPHDKKRFGSYLLKALQNDWNKQGYYPPSSPPRTRPRDVPEWVWRQQEHPSQPSDEDEITPEQKAEIDRLLRLLGEIP